MEVVQEGPHTLSGNIPASNCSWLSQGGVRCSWQHWPKAFFALWSICVADTAWRGVTCTAGRASSPALSTLALQESLEICWAQSALSSKHPGAAGLWGLMRGENDWQVRRGTKLQINPSCIAEFVFPVTGPKCEKKGLHPSLVWLPSFGCHHQLDHQMSAPNRKLKCSTEMSSWKKKWKETESDREGKCKGSCKGLFPDLETLEAGMILGPSWWAFIPKSRTIFPPPVMLNWSGSLRRVVRKRECSAAVLWLFNLAAQTYDLMGSPTGKLFQCKMRPGSTPEKVCMQKVTTISGCFGMWYVMVELEKMSVFSSVLGLNWILIPSILSCNLKTGFCLGIKKQCHFPHTVPLLYAIIFVIISAWRGCWRHPSNIQPVSQFWREAVKYGELCPVIILAGWEAVFPTRLRTRIFFDKWGQKEKQDLTSYLLPSEQSLLWSRPQARTAAPPLTKGVVPKMVLSPSVQEANSQTWGIYLQFCADRGAGWQIHKASMTTTKTFCYLYTLANKTHFFFFFLFPAVELR